MFIELLVLYFSLTIPRQSSNVQHHKPAPPPVARPADVNEGTGVGNGSGDGNGG